MPNPIINRRIGGVQFNNLMANLKGWWPLNDSTANMQAGTITALYSDALYAFSSPGTEIISSGAHQIGALTPVADMHTNHGVGSDYRLQSSAAGLNFPANQQFTATAWVDPESIVNDSPVVCNWGTSGFFLGMSPSTFTINAHDSGNATHPLSSGITPSISNWYFIAGGWDGTNLWIQVNAGARSTLAVATLHAFTDNFSIGSYPGNGGSLPQDSFVAGVGLWFRSLSTDEISQLYNAGSPKANPFIM